MMNFDVFFIKKKGYKMIIQNEYGKISSMILMMKVGGHYATGRY